MEQSLALKSFDRTSSTFRSLWATQKHTVWMYAGMFGSHHFFHGVLQVQASSRPRSRGTTSSHGVVVFFQRINLVPKKKSYNFGPNDNLRKEHNPKNKKVRYVTISHRIHVWYIHLPCILSHSCR